MEKCVQSILQWPSLFSHKEFGHFVHEPFEPGSSLFAVWVYSSWRHAWFNSGYMSRVSSWCFRKVFFVKENSNPEVDSRPAEVRTVSLLVA